jgi:hypothetical protein
VIPGWQAHHYRRALARLVELGLLIIVHRGGRRKGDPRQFRFGKGAPMKPRLVVSNDDNQDFLLVVDLLKRDAAIRDIARALNKSKSQVHRLKQRAVALGLLGELVPDRVPELVPASVVVPLSAEGVPLSAGRGGAGVESLTLTTSFGTKTEERDKAAGTSSTGTPSPTSESGVSGVSPTERGENRAADRENIISLADRIKAAAESARVEPARLGDCMLNLPDGRGGHRACDQPVGLNGIYCREHV